MKKSPKPFWTLRREGASLAWAIIGCTLLSAQAIGAEEVIPQPRTTNPVVVDLDLLTANASGAMVYNDQLFTGTSVQYAEAGKVSEIASWVDGVKNGMYLKSSSDRERFTLGSFVNGKRDGVFFDMRGELGGIFQYGMYVEDMLEGDVSLVNPDGSLKGVITFRGGQVANPGK